MVVSEGVCERCGGFEDVLRGLRFCVEECGSVIDLCVCVYFKVARSDVKK